MSDAAGKRPDNSRRAVTDNKYAAQIASNSKKSDSQNVANQTNVDHAPRNSTKQRVSDPVRGSFEGLQNGSSTMIQMEGTGYASKDAQKARYSKKQIAQISQAQNGLSSLSSFKQNGIINNYSSIAASNTSAFKLNNMLQTNKFF